VAQRTHVVDAHTDNIVDVVAEYERAVELHAEDLQCCRYRNDDIDVGRFDECSRCLVPKKMTSDLFGFSSKPFLPKPGLKCLDTMHKSVDIILDRCPQSREELGIICISMVACDNSRLNVQSAIH